MTKLIRPILLLLAVLTASVAQAGLPIQNWTTSGGTRVYFVEAKTLPILDVSVDFAAGSSRDTPAQIGLASITLSLLANGAGGLSEDEISTRFANIGALSGGVFDQDRAGVSVRTLSNERERSEAVELLAKIVQEPAFPEAVFERERAQFVSSLRQSNAQPESVAERQFLKLLYQDHPYSQRPTEATLKAVTREDVVKFYRTFYTSDNAVVAMIGAITREQAEAIAEAVTKKLPKSNGDIPSLAAVKYPAQAATKEMPFPSSQSHIVMGYPGIKRTDPDYFPLLVGNYVLGGGGFASRLTEEVREKRGLTYNVSSYFMPMRDLGPWRIGFSTRKDQIKDAMEVVRSTIKAFVEAGPTEAELQKAKQNLAGGFPLRLDSNKKIHEYLQIIGFYNLPLSFLDDYVAKVEAVTVSNIKEAFNRRINLDNLVTVVVGLPEAGTQPAAGAPPATGSTQPAAGAKQ
jgi:zinc protease